MSKVWHWILFSLGFVAAVVLTNVPRTPKAQPEKQTLAERLLPTVVDIKIPVKAEVTAMVIGPDGVPELHTSTAAAVIGGAGVFISPNGHILTVAHLFREERTGAIQVTLSNGGVFKARLLAKSFPDDLALMKIERITPYAQLTARPLHVGQFAIAIGSPWSFPFTVSHGMLSFINRQNVDPDFVGLNQTDTFINKGNSGGPLFNEDGELIGINNKISFPGDDPVFTGLGFSVRPETIRKFLAPYRGL